MLGVRNVAFLIGFLAAVGCQTYEPRPLRPESELETLGKVGFEDFLTERAKLGEGNSRINVPFDPSNGLGESEIIAVALTLNPDLRAKRLEIGEARAFLIKAGLWPNPEVGVGWRPGIGGTPGVNADASLLVELLRPWERSARTDAGAARVKEVEASIVAEEWRVVGEARTRRLGVLGAEQTVRILKDQAALRDKLLVLTRDRRKAGEGTEFDVSVAELDAAEVKRDLRKAETELALARMDLNRLLGLPPEFPLGLRDSGQPIKVPIYEDVGDRELERRLLQGRFDLRAKEFAYERSDHELRLAIYRQYPGIKIGPSFSKDFEGNYLGVGATLEIPIFDRNQGDIAERESVRERTRAEYRALLLELKARAYQARAQLRLARLEVETQEKDVLPLVKRNEELYEQAYRAREIHVLDWVTAQERGLRARREYLESLARYLGALTDLESATGFPLSRPVQEPSKKD